MDPQPFVERFQAELDAAQKAGKSMAKKPVMRQLPSYWAPFHGGPYKPADEVDTGLSSEQLKLLTDGLTRYPENFHIHPKVQKLLEQRHEMGYGKRPLDYGMAEALAFGSLAIGGVPIRLSGQDSRRGTFNQRHSVLIDILDEREYVPLCHLAPNQARVEIYNSELSEAAVMGFEYGFARDFPEALVMWEAQFGDFANGAQVIIDQFITSGESKWLRMSGLVLLLPHGYEGQGPEHSSARLERYLQACAEDNLQVVNCTTPANYFHALRRQVHRNFRKPLVVMTPKSLLRHKLAVSRLTAMGPDSSFHRVLRDTGTLVPDAEIRRVVLCSGKVYYDLFEERAKRGIENIYLMRLEQLYPFPVKPLTRDLARFPGAEVIWCQEEPRNMGAWSFVQPEIEAVLESVAGKALRLRYVGRPAAAAPATGLLRRHVKEQTALIEAALTFAS